MRLNRFSTAAAVFALSALCVGGCASKNAPGATSTQLGGTPSHRASAPKADNAADPVHQAQQDAAALLDAFNRLPGAVRSAGQPAGLPTGLAYPIVPPADWPGPHPVTVIGWWTVPAPAATVLAETKSRLPAWGVPARVSGGTDGVSYDSYVVETTGSGTLAERDLTAEVIALGTDRSVLQVKVTESYRPAKPAGDFIPTTAMVTATLKTYSGTSPDPHTDSSVVTTYGNVAGMAYQLNALPTDPVYGPASCPNDGLSSSKLLTLDFRNSVSGPVVAEAVINSSSLGGGPCSGGVLLTIGGKAEPSLDASRAPDLFDSLALLAQLESAIPA